LGTEAVTPVLTGTEAANEKISSEESSTAAAAREVYLHKIQACKQALATAKEGAESAAATSRNAATATETKFCDEARSYKLDQLVAAAKEENQAAKNCIQTWMEKLDAAAQREDVAYESAERTFVSTKQSIENPLDPGYIGYRGARA